MKTVLCLIALLTAFSALRADTASGADGRCGTVDELTRTVMVTRGGRETELAQGDAVYSSDSIKTGELGYAVIKFIDDTLMAIGGNGSVVITEVQFTPRAARFHLGIDRGAVWISIGSIGLVNPNAVKLTTPKALVSSGNATIQFEVGGEENVKVQWIPKGGRVSVYSVKTKERMEMRETDSTIFITSGGELSTKPAETPEDEGRSASEGPIEEETAGQ
jgi:hypothetical protein